MPFDAARTSGTTVAAATRPTHHRHADVDGASIFFREAGPAQAPVVVLLHGFPTSSRMYRDLMPALSDQYRVIAPDYPAFGHSAVPERESFNYSFATYAALVDSLLRQLNVGRYAMYVQDFGAPVGFRLALADPSRVTALIVQNGNAYDDGLGSFFAPLFEYWQDPTPEHRNALRGMLTLDATRWQYLEGVGDPTRIDPDNWAIDYALLQRPGIDAIMLDLFHDYRANISLYPQVHAFLRERQPPSLILWGRNDVIFPVAGAHAFLRDVPHAQLHLLDSGHFALEDKKEEIARLVREFLDSSLAPDGRS